MLTTREDLQKAYSLLVKGIAQTANDSTERAYGGIIRAGKGLMVENLCKNTIRIAWNELGNDDNRLSMEKRTVRIPIIKSYIEQIESEEVKQYINENIKDYYYTLKTDVHVYVDNQFILGAECKAYTENAMLKRILVDFSLFKTQYPNLHCVLYQLESQMGGDYSSISKKITYGSTTTHTLLSYFKVNLNIITLLDGERKVDHPIHSVKYYKELTDSGLNKAIDTFKEILKNC
jgi:hypothetical protein